jgi:hypothetical protein
MTLSLWFVTPTNNTGNRVEPITQTPLVAHNNLHRYLSGIDNSLQAFSRSVRNEAACGKKRLFSSVWQ